MSQSVKKTWLSCNLSSHKIVVFNLEAKTAACSSNSGVAIVLFLVGIYLFLPKIKLLISICRNMKLLRSQYWKHWQKYVILLNHLVRYIGAIVIFQHSVNFSKYLSIFAISAKYLLVFVCLLSQSTVCFHRYWTFLFGSISDKDQIHNRSNIKLTKLKILRFVFGTSSLTILILLSVT